jgi:adenylylsulfate kinase
MSVLHPTHSLISPDDRVRQMRQRSLLIWFTGLSGSGKSTLAVQLEHALFQQGFKVFFLDGDALRTGLNADLGFNEEHRKENIRRAGEVCRLLLDSGLVVITAFISPYRRDRDKVREAVGAGRYFEVYVDTPLEVCEQRDVKGLYKKARLGEIKNFTGIDSPYEIPERPDAIVRTTEIQVEQAVAELLKMIIPRIQL